MPPAYRIGKEPAMRVAYLEVRGPYSEIGEAILRLDRWVKSRGATRAGFPFCMFFDNPFETPEADLRSAACIPIGGNVAPEEDFLVKDLPEVVAAETRHEGPPAEFGKTYGPFLEALLKEGFAIPEPAREYFRDVNEVMGPGSGSMIRQPIVK